MGTRLIAYYVASPATTPTTTELRSFLQEKLPDYMIPSAFVSLEALPLTPSGKVNRKALPAVEPSRPELEQAFVAPRTDIEQTLARIWSQVLEIDRVGIYDNFFELGGHSLLAAQIVYQVRDILQLEVPLRLVFDSPTVAGLAAFINRQQPRVASHEQLEQMMAEMEKKSDELVDQPLSEESEGLQETHQ